MPGTQREGDTARDGLESWGWNVQSLTGDIKGLNIILRIIEID